MAALMLASCSAEEPSQAPSSSPIETALFATDKQAAQAAMDAYARYLAVNAAINADHGKDPERILDVTTASYGTQLLAEFREMRDAGVYITGSGVVEGWQVAAVDRSRRDIELGLCLGVGNTRVMNSDGEDVTPERADVNALAVRFKAVARDRVLLDGSQVWPGEQFC